GLPYPRSALQVFKQVYGGFLVEGQIYDKLVRGSDGRLFVVLENGVPEEEALAQRFLGGDIRVTSPVGAAESAVAISPANRDLVIAGSNGPSGGQKMHYSIDGGASWNGAAALPLGGSCCDPTVDWSSDGSLAYTATLGGCGGGPLLCNIWLYRSGDNGQTWNHLETVTPGDPRRELTNSQDSDKEYLHVDRHAGSAYKDNVYLTWHDNNVIQFARSTDSGNTWSTQAFSAAADKLGIGNDLASDKSGNVYVFWPAFNSQKIWVAKSTDGGVSFGTPVEVATTLGSFIFPIPSMDLREVFIYVSADVDLTAGPYAERIYVAWTDSTAATNPGVPSANHARIQVAHSSDGGATWNVTTPHETADAATVDRWHQWLKVGSDGTVHVVFYDTRQALPGRDAVDMYHSLSADGGVTWTTPNRLSTASSPSIADSFEFGDYNGLDVRQTDLIAIFTDNRNEGGPPGDSVDVYATGVQGCFSQVELNLPVLPPETVNHPRTEEACDRINAGDGGYAIIFPGNVTFGAGLEIVLENGFEVQNGALFSAEIGPVN
ncbi:MAG: glycoside hydrolase, partial [Acidobacteriota bacterium]|nr:glycoside hydrolase [Acidobacteriota bacterium]